LYRINSDLSGLDYVIARDMGTEMTITSIDSNIVSLLGVDLSGVTSGPIQVVRSGTARKFQVLSVTSGLSGLTANRIPTGNMYYTDLSNSAITNIGGNGEAYVDSDGIHATSLFDINGLLTINDALIVGEDQTSTTSTTQSLPFGTFWAINDPVVIQYKFSDSPVNRAIKNRIDEIAAKVPQAQLLKLGNCGHSPHKDQPEKVLQALKYFSSSLGKIHRH
jgi:pimeloyl-ACP methyl ester carboxylesterase